MRAGVEDGFATNSMTHENASSIGPYPWPDGVTDPGRVGVYARALSRAWDVHAFRTPLLRRAAESSSQMSQGVVADVEVAWTICRLAIRSHTARWSRKPSRPAGHHDPTCWIRSAHPPLALALIWGGREGGEAFGLAASSENE